MALWVVSSELELSKGEARMVVDGDVEVIPTGPANVIALAVAGHAVAGALDAGQFLNVEVNRVHLAGRARSGAPVEAAPRR